MKDKAVNAPITFEEIVMVTINNMIKSYCYCVKFVLE